VGVRRDFGRCEMAAGDVRTGSVFVIDVQRWDKKLMILDP
jgi:hypothetical protein